MIQANELRIGNYIRNVIGTPKIIRVDCVTFEIIGDESSQAFEPIPLTPELLERVSVHVYNDDEPHNRIQIGMFTFSRAEDGLLLFDDTLSPFSEQKIKYVHQLQNLYFALTGTELEVSL